MTDTMTIDTQPKPRLRTQNQAVLRLLQVHEEAIKLLQKRLPLATVNSLPEETSNIVGVVKRYNLVGAPMELIHCLPQKTRNAAVFDVRVFYLPSAPQTASSETLDNADVCIQISCPLLDKLVRSLTGKPAKIASKHLVEEILDLTRGHGLAEVGRQLASVKRIFDSQWRSFIHSLSVALKETPGYQLRPSQLLLKVEFSRSAEAKLPYDCHLSVGLALKIPQHLFTTDYRIRKRDLTFVYCGLLEVDAGLLASEDQAARAFRRLLVEKVVELAMPKELKKSLYVSCGLQYSMQYSDRSVGDSVFPLFSTAASRKGSGRINAVDDDIESYETSSMRLANGQISVKVTGTDAYKLRIIRFLNSVLSISCLGVLMK